MMLLGMGGIFMVRKFAVLLCALILVFSFAACETKKKCAMCGKTEDETELFLFDTSVHPGADGKYYCSMCYRIAFSEAQIPGIADEIDKVVETTDDETAPTEETTGATVYQPLAAYIYENIHLMGIVIEPSIEFDVNKDGYPDYCSNVFAGSGIVNEFIAVYDVHNQQCYLLNERGDYDYRIMGCAADVIAVRRSEYENPKKQVFGTIVIEDGVLVFSEDV